MEINYQPLSAEAFIRSMNVVTPVIKTPQKVTPTVTPILVPSIPQIGATPPTESNSIKWVKLIVGLLAVAGVLYVVHHYFKEDERKG